MVNRFAVVLAAALGIASALFLFLPASANGENCGVWISPSFGKAEAQAAYDKTAGASEEALADERAAVKDTANSTYQACDDKLDSRRLWTILTFAAALAAAPAVLVIAGLEERQTATL